jgi:hypothetical protein
MVAVVQAVMVVFQDRVQSEQSEYYGEPVVHSRQLIQEMCNKDT